MRRILVGGLCVGALLLAVSAWVCGESKDGKADDPVPANGNDTACPTVMVSPTTTGCELGDGVEFTAKVTPANQASSVTWASDSGTFSTPVIDSAAGTSKVTFHLNLCAKTKPKPQVTASCGCATPAIASVTPTGENSVWQKVTFDDCDSGVGDVYLHPNPDVYSCGNRILVHCINGTIYIYFRPLDAGKFEVGKCCFDHAYHQLYVETLSSGTQNRFVGVFHFNCDVPCNGGLSGDCGDARPTIPGFDWRVRKYDFLDSTSNFDKLGHHPLPFNSEWSDPHVNLDGNRGCETLNPALLSFPNSNGLCPQ